MYTWKHLKKNSKPLLLLLAKPLKRRHRRRRVGVGVVLLQRHVDIVCQVQVGLGVVRGLEVDHQVILDGKHRVDVQVRVVAGVDLVDNGGIVRVRDHQMDVSRTHRGAVHEVEQHSGRAVGGQRVRSRVVAVPVELAVLVGNELAAQVVIRLVGVLEVVLAVGGRLPDVEHSANDGLAGLHVLQHTVHVGDLALGVRVLDDAVAERTEWRIGRPEGAENDIRGRRDTLVGGDFVGDFVDQTANVSLFVWCSFVKGELTIPDR